jgi:AcrR family transcriptional regulator
MSPVRGQIIIEAVEDPAGALDGGRERLLGAMVRVAARHGYAGANVSRVVELAGTSRARFYEHFGNREECFLAAQEEAAGRALRCIGGERGRRVRIASVLEDVLVRSAENPAAARLLLVETPGGTRAARLRFESFLAGIEALVDDSLAVDRAPQLPASALLDGVAGVIAARLLRGSADALPFLADDLLSWGRGYRPSAPAERLSRAEWQRLGRPMPPAQPAGEGDLALLPRGRSALHPAAGAASRRRRIVIATAELAARKGFADLTVTDIVTAARVPRSAFYTQFAGKEQAFLAVQEETLGEAIAAAAARYALGGSWPERVWGGLEALLYYVAERPNLARAGIIEAPAAGNTAVARSHEICLAFMLFLEEGFRECGRQYEDPRVCGEAIAFAIQGVMRRTIIGAGAGRLPELLPLCSHIALAPLIGSERSLDFVTTKARAVG